MGISTKAARRQQERWCAAQTLTPLMEGLEAEMQEEGEDKKVMRSWEIIRKCFRLQKATVHGIGDAANISTNSYNYNNNVKTRQDMRLLLGVLGCPLAPIPLPLVVDIHDSVHRIHVKGTPIENCRAHYIIQQYLAATGCLKVQTDQKKPLKNMYVSGVVKMICCETEISSGDNAKSLRTRSGESNTSGRFVVWQMMPGMWSLELVIARHHKVLAGSDGKTVWRHTPWLGTHVAKGPQRPLRRIIQGLDPKSTGSLFAQAQYLGEKRIGEEDCFVLKVAAEREAIMERSEGSAEVLRHVLYGYFSQKSGLLIYLEDSHLTRVQSIDCDEMMKYIYWETTIGSSIEDYRQVEGLLIAQQGRSIATVFRFEEASDEHSRTRMEEFWRIDDVEFNVPGLSVDSFMPPADIFHANSS